MLYSQMDVSVFSLACSLKINKSISYSLREREEKREKLAPKQDVVFLETTNRSAHKQMQGLILAGGEYK